MFHVMQAESSTLQQELQDLQSSTAEAEKQLQSEVSSLQGQLETALAECAKASQVQGQLDMALKNSRNADQQRDAAFKARRAAEVCRSPASRTLSDLAMQQTFCFPLSQHMQCSPFMNVGKVLCCWKAFKTAPLQCCSYTLNHCLLLVCLAQLTKLFFATSCFLP